jgi:GNAT superfamily N-acetyltransferase
MIKIRPFRKNDTDEIIKLVTTIIKEFLNFTNDDLNNLIIDLSDIKKNYINKSGNFIVCVVNDKIIGTIAILSKKNGAAKLKRMYLYKKYRGKNYGTKMYEYAENWCITNNFNKIFLSTYPPFTGSKFYEKMGFKKYKKVGKKTFYKKYLKTNNKH